MTDLDTVASAPQSLSETFSERLRRLPADSGDYVPKVVNLILSEARRQRASDIHLDPMADALHMKWRIDGVIQSVASFDRELGMRMIARTKVLAGLLTYRTDQPQEGRIAHDSTGDPTVAETRVATLPTMHGERAAIRLFADSGQLRRLNDLRLPADIDERLRDLLRQTAGVILVTGPSGSGKTTTLYACLRELLATSGESRSLMTLEDPIEQAVAGAIQSQVRSSAGFDLAVGLKALMRQDPDVIMVGEIRDGETAEQVFRAALTGHLVLTTFHAGSSVEAVARLLELGIEPYLVRSTLRAIVCQRLLRRACGCAGQPGICRSSDSSDNPAGEQHPASCPVCSGTRYHGRFVVGECLDPDNPEFAAALLRHADTQTLQSIAKNSGMMTLAERAQLAVDSGLTTSEEVFRVLGRSVEK